MTNERVSDVYTRITDVIMKEQLNTYILVKLPRFEHEGFLEVENESITFLSKSDCAEVTT